MKLTVNDLTEVRLKTHPAIRFSVTVIADDGEPLWTCEGWLMNDLREVNAPGVMTRWGLKRFHKLSPRFTEMLRAAIEKNFPGIDEVLGKPVTEDEIPEIKTLKGEAEVL